MTQVFVDNLFLLTVMKTFKAVARFKHRAVELCFDVLHAGFDLRQVLHFARKSLDLLVQQRIAPSLFQFAQALVVSRFELEKGMIDVVDELFKVLHSETPCVGCHAWPWERKGFYPARR